jgi:hypothetical protein
MQISWRWGVEQALFYFYHHRRAFSPENPGPKAKLNEWQKNTYTPCPNVADANELCLIIFSQAYTKAALLVGLRTICVANLK